MPQPSPPPEFPAPEAAEPPRRGVAVLAVDGRWAGADAGIEALLGHAAAELVGGPAHRRLFPEHARRIDDALVAPGSGVAAVGPEFAWRHPDGGERRLLLEVGALPGVPGRCLLLLRVADARAGERDRQQDEYWSYGISHELRASLRAIEGYARQLDATRAGALDDDGRRWLARIRDSAADAGGLIEAMLEYARAAVHPLASRPVDVSLLAEWVLAELQDAEPQRDADIAVQPGLAALGDERQLKRALGHVLHNAWKFSSARERVEIRVDGERSGSRLLLRIRDRGAGFDPAHADKLFVPFRRLHGAEAGAGHGLGLAIAQRIIERHGGSVRALSAPGAGSTFHIELPAPEAATPS